MPDTPPAAPGWRHREAIGDGQRLESKRTTENGVRKSYGIIELVDTGKKAYFTQDAVKLRPSGRRGVSRWRLAPGIIRPTSPHPTGFPMPAPLPLLNDGRVLGTEPKGQGCEQPAMVVVTKYR